MSAGKNPFPNENNTGHFWDDDNDIRELSNRPPRWYMFALYTGLIAVVVYSAYFPTIPWFGDHLKGTANWTQIEEMKDGVKQLEDYRANKFADLEKAIAEKSLEDIVRDEQLRNYSVRTAKVLFGDNCAACHGAGGSGNEGFPVLADDDWLYGGSLKDIHMTLQIGRKGNMPARMAGITDGEADKLADYLLKVSETGKPDPTNPAHMLYLTKACIGCHGADMKGNKMMGSANLADGIWRFKAKDQKASIVRTILHGVNQGHDPMTQDAVMPAFGQSKVVSPSQLKKIVVYVHQLGGGEPVKSAEEVAAAKVPTPAVAKKAEAPKKEGKKSGEELYTSLGCAGCHGPGGKSAVPAFPTLAGKDKNYIIEQLHAFQEGKRNNPLMAPNAMKAKGHEEAIASYLSGDSKPEESKAPSNNSSSGGDVAKGEAQYTSLGCSGCHGPGGKSMVPSFPALAGKDKAYIVEQLHAFQSGKRNNPLMAPNAMKAKGHEEDIAAYLSSVK
ncbi:MAG: cytochrome-c oxidase, cbb3-type subunit III [Gammaproteobacteria bacterium]